MLMVSNISLVHAMWVQTWWGTTKHLKKIVLKKDKY
jgi:hypothetical protein